jgi:cobalamin biosynthesis Mg chelatase CobN
MKYAIILLVVIVMVGCFNNKEGMCASTCSTCSNFVFDKDDNKCSMEQCFDCKNMRHTNYVDQVYKLLYPSISTSNSTSTTTTTTPPSTTTPSTTTPSKQPSPSTTTTPSPSTSTSNSSSPSYSNETNSTGSEPFHLLLGLFLLLLVLIGYLIKYSLNV